MPVLFLLAMAVAARAQSGGVFNVLSYGAVGDGKTKDTAAIRKAIAAASASKAQQRTVLFPGPSYTFLTGSLNFSSGLIAYVEPGAVILGSKDYDDYPVIAPLPSFGGSRDGDFCCRHAALINCFDCNGFSITGTGVVDGNGAAWWGRPAPHYNASRPHLFEVYSSNATFIGNPTLGQGMLTFRNSPFWTTHIFNSSNTWVRQLYVQAPPGRDAGGHKIAPNTDGIDPDSSENVLIEDSILVTGDDGIAIKSGLNNAGIGFGVPSRNIEIRNVSITAPCCGGVAIGSEMSGGVARVKVFNTTIHAAQHGLNIKTSTGRGGYVTDLILGSGDQAPVLMGSGVQTALRVTGDYSGNCHEPSCNSSALPVISNISFTNIRTLPGQSVGQAGSFDLISGDRMSHMTFDHIDLDASSAWDCGDMDASTLTVDDVSPSGLSRACGK